MKNGEYEITCNTIFFYSFLYLANVTTSYFSSKPKKSKTS